MSVHLVGFSWGGATALRVAAAAPELVDSLAVIEPEAYALLRDYDIRPVVVHPTKRADFSRHGYRAAHFDDAFARFLPHEPNIRTLKRGREGM